MGSKTKLIGKFNHNRKNNGLPLRDIMKPRRTKEESKLPGVQETREQETKEANVSSKIGEEKKSTSEANNSYSSTNDGMSVHEECSSFEDLGIKPWLINQCKSLGIKSPTPVQKGCIRGILKGMDCIGAAKTGSGKTFAFALPMLQHLSDDPYGIFALVLTPTHELAHQIGDQFSILGKSMGVRVCVVTGGNDQVIEGQNLAKRPHIVVAMPGRLADHINGCDTFKLNKIKYFVIDEADRLLSGSYDDDLRTILEKLPKKRQTLLFSATITEQIRENQLFSLDRENLHVWTQEMPQVTVHTLDQRYVLCPGYARDVFLVEVIRTYLKEHPDGNILIFTTTKKDCQIISMMLNNIGLENVCLHGYMKQRDRAATLARFRSKVARVLVATNVASRGLDIPAVELVVNHKLPQESDEYIHRVGRTARAGRSGMAISLITPHDLVFLEAIEKRINTKLNEYKIDENAAAEIFTQVSVLRREVEIGLDNEDFDEKAKNYRRKKWILKGVDPDLMESKYQMEIKHRRKQSRKGKILKMNEMKRNLRNEMKNTNSEEINQPQPDKELAQSSKSNVQLSMKSVNKVIMKKDKRFKNLPSRLTRIGKKTEISKTIFNKKVL